MPGFHNLSPFQEFCPANLTQKDKAIFDRSLNDKAALEKEFDDQQQWRNEFIERGLFDDDDGEELRQDFDKEEAHKGGFNR